MKNIFRTFAPLRLCGIILLCSFLSACASLPPEFYNKDRSFSAYGLYNISPTTGVSGFGAINFDSVKPTDPRLDELTDRLNTLETAVKYLLQRIIDAADSVNPKSKI